MKIAVVVFPGSNCDHDAWYAVSQNLHEQAEFIWHESSSLAGADAVILPGGFSYGDYLRCGAIAKFSPVMKAVAQFARDGGPVLGICNGFQVLTEAGLLPGALVRNAERKFVCRTVPLEVVTTDSLFTNQATRGLDPEANLRLKLKQGRVPLSVEMKITDDAGKSLPHDGETFGRLKVRGPFIAAHYFKNEGGEILDEDGFFDTGDVATIDPAGFMQITDRAKDVIKSGGEWISSVELENALMAHPCVLEAAVFAGRHPKWDERPIAAVVLKSGQSATEEELATHLAGKFAKFWLPDAYVFVAQIPRTSTGKFLKTKLREQYGDMLVKG